MKIFGDDEAALRIRPSAHPGSHSRNCLCGSALPPARTDHVVGSTTGFSDRWDATLSQCCAEIRSDSVSHSSQN